MTRISLFIVLGILPAFLLLGLTAAVAADKEAGREDAVFEMREVSALEKNDIASGRLMTQGSSVVCSTEPDKAVKAYPKLNSKQPLYGKLSIDRNASRGKSPEYHFVLDESEETPPIEEKKEEKKAGEKKDGKAGPARILPKREARLSRYDRLYIDLNRDLDLTNDPVVKPMKDQTLVQDLRAREKMNFDLLEVEVDFGPGVGIRPFRLFPYFTAYEDKTHKTVSMMHFAAAVARQGRIRIGSHEYDALLAQPYFATGRFDRPTTTLFLKPVDPKEKLDSYGLARGSLATMHRVDGEFYSISASPLGDKLTVKPYRGDYGVFQIGPGARDIKDISVQGSLQSESMEIDFGPDHAPPGGEQKKESEYKLPVGEYLPSLLSIEYGRLWLMLSDNYHSEGGSRNIIRHRNYFIKVRKDKPFVLDFADKPEVIFASPAKDATFKPGDEISIKAVLIDPVCNIMIRRMFDLSKKNGGNKTGAGRNASLDPLVTIADSAGKTVAQGPMPFG